MKYNHFKKIKNINIKTIILIFIVVFILLGILFNAINKHNKIKEEIKIENENPNIIFYDKNNSISIELSKGYGLSQYEPGQNYLIELRSKDNLDIFISKQNPIEKKDLNAIVKADRLAYTQKFNSFSNLSDIKELSVNNNLAYTYSFHYLDSNLNKAFYIQIAWLQINDIYYVFDIEFPLDDLTIYTNIITDTLANFKVIQP